MRIASIAQTLGLPFTGDDIDISGMNTLADACGTELSFLNDTKYTATLSQSRAGAVLIPDTALKDIPEGMQAIVCDNVAVAMARTTALFAPPLIDRDADAPEIGETSFVDPRASVEKGAQIGRGCTIMAGAYLGSGVMVGDGTVIFPNVTIYRDCHIGAHCRIHGGATIGADGFGYAHTATGEHVKIFQNGNVIIDDDVEIGSNCSIDRAVFASTRVRYGSKIDNNVHIGHNCDIGEHCILVAQVGVGGSTILGRNCVVSGQTAFTDHLEIAPFTTFTARTGVTKSIQESGRVFSGYPMMEHRRWVKLQSLLGKMLKAGERKK